MDSSTFDSDFQMASLPPAVLTTNAPSGPKRSMLHRLDQARRLDVRRSENDMQRPSCVGRSLFDRVANQLS